MNFRPTASWQRLHQRARLLAAVRRFFDERGFLRSRNAALVGRRGRRPASRSDRRHAARRSAPARRRPADVAANLARIRHEAAVGRRRRGDLSDHPFVSRRRSGPAAQSRIHDRRMVSHAAMAWPRRCGCSPIWPRCFSARTGRHDQLCRGVSRRAGDRSAARARWPNWPPRPGGRA